MALAYITSRPERSKEAEQVVPLDPNQNRDHLALIRLAVTNVLADLFTGMSKQTYFVYDEDTNTCLESVHIHGLHETARVYGLNMKEVALETAAQV